VIFVLALYGGYYYVSRHYRLEDASAFVESHKDASWAPRAAYGIGLFYHERGEYAKSQDAFNRFMVDFSTHPLAARGLFYLEDSAESNHDWDTARAAAERYIEEHPDGPESGLIRQRLEMLNYNHAH
jgi:TolA-binding protein